MKLPQYLSLVYVNKFSKNLLTRWGFPPEKLDCFEISVLDALEYMIDTHGLMYSHQITRSKEFGTKVRIELSRDGRYPTKAIRTYEVPGDIKELNDEAYAKAEVHIGMSLHKYILDDFIKELDRVEKEVVLAKPGINPYNK